MAKILILEDDESIQKELKELLINASYEALCLTNFQEAEKEIEELHPDLILLDINIPYLNGQSLLQTVRKKSDVPIIMVTSKNTEADEVLSMSYGADDFISKPYNPNILLLRIVAVLKRVTRTSDIVRYKGLEINLQKGLIKTGTDEILLTKNEMIILNYLLTHQDKIVTRDELMTDLWNNQEYINDNALTVNMSRLRSKLASAGLLDAIETRKKVGYRLK